MAALREAPFAPETGDSSLPENGQTFRVALDNFEGPFDLLLSLITQRELDITEVSLSLVTDEFLSYLSGLEDDADLGQASEFLVVAATLLDLKIASLLPQGEVVDAEDLALLEARDLLFARLLQYRAFKEATAWFRGRLAREERRNARSVRLEERFRDRTPELVWTLNPAEFAALARVAMAPREEPSVGLAHLHDPLVSLREQAAILMARLRPGTPLSFRELIDDTVQRGVIVARFLGLLELFRQAAVAFEQAEPLGELTVRWAAAPGATIDLSALGAEYDPA